jgi:hypothetical protein
MCPVPCTLYAPFICKATGKKVIVLLIIVYNSDFGCCCFYLQIILR